MPCNKSVLKWCSHWKGIFSLTFFYISTFSDEKVNGACKCKTHQCYGVEISCQSVAKTFWVACQCSTVQRCRLHSLHNMLLTSIYRADAAGPVVTFQQKIWIKRMDRAKPLSLSHFSISLSWGASYQHTHTHTHTHKQVPWCTKWHYIRHIQMHDVLKGLQCYLHRNLSKNA